MQCNRCGSERPAKEFPWKNKAEHKRHGYCKVCGREISRGQYAKKRQYYMDKATKRRRQLVKIVRRFVLDYLLAHPCVDCGEAHPAALDFDHVRGRKRGVISKMAHTGYSLAAIKAEIAKCAVRCSNCHRKRTAKRAGWYSWAQK
ncbi:hypothetical protein LCGC14_0399950 [marine sediment metagenome]|uniref:HNH domain-containing protein n=1 Tax=marine sediment metagenome TaxID=412755 RepID=A0A0F9W672_9ZZZZ